MLESVKVMLLEELQCKVSLCTKIFLHLKSIFSSGFTEYALKNKHIKSYIIYL